MVKETLTTEIITPSIMKLMNEIEEKSFLENNIEDEENEPNPKNQTAKVKNKAKNP